MQDFWSWAPPELVEARDRSANASNLVRTFMMGLSPDDVPDRTPACVVRDAKCYTAFSNLEDTYHEFVTHHFRGKVPSGVQRFTEQALLGEKGDGGVVSRARGHLFVVS